MVSSYYYNKTLFNNYLGVTKTIKAQTEWELSLKEKEILKKWTEQEAKKREKERIEDLKDKADFMNSEAQELIDEYNTILQHTLSINDRLNWNEQLKKDEFPDFIYNVIAPSIADLNIEYKVPKPGFIEKVVKSRKIKREQLEKHVNDEYEKLIRNYNADKETEYQKYLENKKKFDNEIKDFNNAILKWKEDFESGEVESIEKYINLVLENSSYPNDFNREYEVQYIPEIKTCVVSYILPNPQNIPNIIGHKYVASSKTIKSIEMKKKEFEGFYERIIMQLTLRTIHEIFESVYTPHVEYIVFNGWVNGTDPSNGKDFTSCIISVQVPKNDFVEINLEKVEPKACIKQLKGLIAGPLAQLAPVRPIVDINKNDRRFVESKDVLADINSTTNLASMDWEDFEHLVRQLFEKMFSESGGEVKVTQASRDGGVDAIAFDPDPIRGGKFVIQAKRYNNVVSVSAVRDLYGTLINEGASKGILVTTSYFGPDSREFIKDKPITLIDGSNLVYLFSKHGYKVRIDLRK
jgi:restriction system protein